MKQRLLTGWTIFLIMLSVSYSCSNEMDNVLEREIEEVIDLRLDQDGALTRSGPWDEEEESALEWAEDREGTGPYSPWAPHEFKFISNLESVAEDDYNYYADFSWGAGFVEEGTGKNVSDQYYLQIQWSYTDDYYAVWSYINMPGNKYGLVKVLGDGVLEKISAYAFPYNTTRLYVYLRMRTIHEDFIGSAPVPEVESQYKYDYSLFSSWSYPATIGDPYRNYWGYDKPLPTIDDIVNGESVLDETSFIVSVYLPFNTDKYKFSYEMYNHSSDYIQSLGGTMNNSNEGKAIGTNIGNNGGQIEVIAKRTNKLTDDIDYETVFRDYSAHERNVDIYISEYAFGYD